MLAFVGATGLLYALGYMGEELTRGHVLHRRYNRFFCVFNFYLFAMLLATNVDNIALMWIAIEGSTLSAALLIGFEKTKAALEAGWKYIILSFVGNIMTLAQVSSWYQQLIKGLIIIIAVAVYKQRR